MPYEDRGKNDKAIVNVVALIDNEGGKLLMVQEGIGDVKGKWSLPAGRIEFGEDPVTAVKREAKEETGLKVEPVSIAGIQAFQDSQGFAVLRFNFHCEVKGGQLQTSEEISDVQWYSQEEIKELNKTGKLRSKKTWLSIENWLEGTKFPLETINVLQEKI